MRRYIERYGVEAVTGRKVLSYGELRRMEYTENIVTYYRAWQQSKNEESGWAGWTKDNPAAMAALTEAREAAEELDDGGNG